MAASYKEFAWNAKGRMIACSLRSFNLITTCQHHKQSPITNHGQALREGVMVIAITLTTCSCTEFTGCSCKPLWGWLAVHSCHKWRRL